MDNIKDKFLLEISKLLNNFDLEKIQNLDFSDLSKIFFENTILFYALGFIFIMLTWKFLKFPLKILKKIVVNSIFGYLILYVLLIFKIVIVPFTYLSYFLVGSFGIIGIILSYIIYL